MTALSTAARHSSVSNEHYSPAAVVEAARATLGAIDLDPASCEFANRAVRAETIWTAERDGFVVEWRGRVFLNPPGGRSDNLQRPVLPKCSETGACGLPIGHVHEGTEASAKKWWFKLAREWSAGRVDAAIFVGFSLEILQSTQVDTPDGAPIPLDFPICFPSRRVAYDRDVEGKRTKGSSPPHASAIVCVSTDREVVRRFVEAFSPLGRVSGAWSGWST